MVISNFDQLILKVRNFQNKKRIAVVAANDEHTLEAVFKAKDNDIIAEPILIGEREEIEKILKEMNIKIGSYAIVNTTDDSEAAYKGVELVNKKEVDFLMKGKIQTADILKAVVDKEKGIRTGKVMSHFVANEIPNYHKLLVTTDGGMLLYPDVEQKKNIIENAVHVLKTMGYERPKVAVLAAVEKVNSKMPESVDASQLKEMNKNGEIEGCIVEGPISYDLAMSKESAGIKGYESPVTGDVDIMIVPNITAGNILGKSLVYSAGAKMAGFIVGAKVPIVLTSRGSSSEEKFLSIVLSAAASK